VSAFIFLNWMVFFYTWTNVLSFFFSIWWALQES
jgi:hypothetical protein